MNYISEDGNELDWNNLGLEINYIYSYEFI